MIIILKDFACWGRKDIDYVPINDRRMPRLGGGKTFDECQIECEKEENCKGFNFSNGSGNAQSHYKCVKIGGGKEKCVCSIYLGSYDKNKKTNANCKKYDNNFYKLSK